VEELQEEPTPLVERLSSDSEENAAESVSEDQSVSDAPELFDFPGSPKVYPREQHPISRKLIDHDCLKVMYRLIRAGYKAFLVGGGVRDLLLGKKPKDFDIGTSAKPEEIRKLFRNSRIIGRRFRMNQVYFRGGKIFEVATFRAKIEDDSESPKMLAMDNTYGNEESDAIRRDLTINGLFYDPNSYAVIDYVGGMDDLKAGIIRVIGEPAVRFQEDPVRMIRAVRHAARTDFEIEPKTLSAINDCAGLITKVVKARVYDELIRDVKGGFARKALPMLHDFGLLKLLMPELDRLMSEEDGELKPLLLQTLERLDRKILAGEEVPTSVALLALCIDSFASKKPGEKFKQTIDALYREVGVTRRDREDMEKLVNLAHQLFRIAQVNQEKAESLAQKELVKEALMLIELNSNNEVGDQALKFWSSKIRPRRPPSQRRRR
jgi:poly(A) polymerase